MNQYNIKEIERKLYSNNAVTLVSTKEFFSNSKYTKKQNTINLHCLQNWAKQTADGIQSSF